MGLSREIECSSPLKPVSSYQILFNASIFPEVPNLKVSFARIEASELLPFQVHSRLINKSSLNELVWVNAQVRPAYVSNDLLVLYIRPSEI